MNGVPLVLNTLSALMAILYNLVAGHTPNHRRDTPPLKMASINTYLPWALPENPQPSATSVGIWWKINKSYAMPGLYIIYFVNGHYVTTYAKLFKRMKISVCILA